MKHSKRYILLLILLVASLITYAQNSGAGAKKEQAPIWLSDCENKLDELRKSNEIEPITQALPIFGKQAREQGYTLPLPFGVGTSFMVMRQTNKISDFRLVVDGTEVPYDVKFYNAVSTDFNATFRPDIWIFPFMNVYGVLGYTSGSIKPNVLIPGLSATLPNLGDVEIIEAFELNDLIEYKGSTMGLGTTLAGGFKSYFFTLDYNYTWSNMDVIPTTVKVQTITPRVGILLEGFKTLGTGTLWIGARYVDINQEVTDQIVNLRETDPELADILGDELGYAMTMGVEDPLNFIIGGAWSPSQRTTLVFEAGVGDRSQLLISVDYRF